MNGKHFSQEKARKNGFYLALAVCMVAVGIAAWSTYDAVHGYLSPDNDALNPVSTASPVQQEPDPEDPEAPRSTATPRPTASPARGGAAIPTSETPAPSSAPVVSAPKETGMDMGDSSAPAEPETMVPANAPLYELSQELIYPVGEGEILKAYSAGAPVYSETMRDWRIHAGLDLAAESGETVLACGNGQVKETYSDPMLGNVVLIEHGDYAVSYCGLGENFLVAPGDIVTAGQPIGTVTAIPSEMADEPHLHMEVRRDGAYLDPASVLTFS